MILATFFKSGLGTVQVNIAFPPAIGQEYTISAEHFILYGTVKSVKFYIDVTDEEADGSVGCNVQLE